MTLDETCETLRAAALKRKVDVAERLRPPAIGVEATMVNTDTISIGASKLGGRPALPPALLWPERGGEPTGFLAQFKLGEVAPYAVGRVSSSLRRFNFVLAFANDHVGVVAEDQGAWRAIYASEASSSLARRAWPSNLASLYKLPTSSPASSM